MYNGPGLNGLRETDSPNLGKAQRRWHIHVNPDDITRVYLRRPDTRKWCTLLWRDAPTDLPMTEDGVKYARRLAAARGTSTEPDAALAGMLEEWGLGLGRSTVERRIALRLAKERAELLGEFATEDEPDARVFIAECRKARSAAQLSRHPGKSKHTTPTTTSTSMSPRTTPAMRRRSKMRSTTQTRSKNRDPATKEKICTATKSPKLSDRSTSTARTAVRKNVGNFDKLTLSRKEGFKIKAEGPRREQPDELTATQLGNLGSSAHYEYDEQRDIWHANLPTIKTTH